MSRLFAQFQFPILFLFVVSFGLSLIPERIDARDIVSASDFDTTTMELGSSYNVAAVREAISECRDGNFSAALPVLKEYAAKHDVGATYVLATLYLDGLGVEKSVPKAIELLTQNVAGNHAPSMVKLGLIYQEESPAKTMQLFKRASAGNYPVAHLKLGNVFENGLLGTRSNSKLAHTYYQKAHKQGHVLGTFHIARCNDEGIGVSPNAIEATRLYRQAAMSGAGIANAEMARRYFAGIGVESDPGAAVGWLVRGSQAGSTEAMVLLGQRYQTGDVIGRDLNRAGQLYSAAAMKNDPVGKYQLAMMYLNGIGTPKDPARAYVLLEGAQSFLAAKKQFEELKNKLTDEQLAQAQKKIEEAGRTR
jgi:TPR repeat protein